MRIDRLEVAGGFLDGLEVDFEDGLNVLVGARGAGKTSVIELIRFALAIPAKTEAAAEDARKQAVAVLGDGTAAVYCSAAGRQTVFSRTGLDEMPTASSAYSSGIPLIVSQNEIEAIGLDPSSRREILDRLVDPLLAEDGAGSSRSEVAATERRLETHREERDEVAEATEREGDLASTLSAAEKKQKAGAAAEVKLEKLQDEVSKLADELGQERAAGDAYGLAAKAIAEWRDEIADVALAQPLPGLPSAAHESEVTKRLDAAAKLLENAGEELGGAEKSIAEAHGKSKSDQNALQKKLKSKTERLEKLQKGAGEVGRRVSTLRQELKAIQAQRKRLTELNAQIAKLRNRRDQMLDRSEASAEEQYKLRDKTAEQLTERFNGRIEVRVDKSGELGAYEAALVELLQGSNLRYKNLAQKLAEKLSPRELVNAIESEDAARIAEVGGINEDRATRLLAHLENHSLSTLLLAPLNDAVDFALLDGQEYKVTRNLSMGQRCTVVLPMLLAEGREAILLDQPEDHLDNAFIVDTLVSAIRQRSATGQVIVATHNANIPVLGEAAQVIVLASDGRRGFVSSADELDSDPSVQAITTLMEGGREAFSKRAEFYSDHPDG